MDFRGTVDEYGNPVQADLDEDGTLVVTPTVEYEGVEYTLVDVDNITRQTNLKRLVIPDGVRRVRNISLCPQLRELVVGKVEHLIDIQDLPALEYVDIAEWDDFGPLIENCFNNVGLTHWVADKRLLMQERCLLNCSRLEKLDLTDFFQEYDYDGNGSYTELSQIGNDCPALKELRFPDFCYGEISWVARGCRNITTVYMPGNAWPGTILTDCVTSSPMLSEIYCPGATPLDVRVTQGFEYNSMSVGNQKVNGTIGGSVDYQNCKVYVPVGSVDAYREHPSWKPFANIIEYDFASLKEVESDISDFGIRVEGNSIVSDSGDFEVYNLAGKRCADHGLTSGVYIVRSSTGAILKVVVR